MAINRKKRHFRLRKKISGTSDRPRLSVFRSLKGMYAQIINDDLSITLLGLSHKSLSGKTSGTEKKNKSKGSMKKKELAYELGKKIAEAAVGKNIKTVVFDRGGNKYHGRIAEFARGAREGGLIF